MIDLSAREVQRKVHLEGVPLCENNFNGILFT